MGSSDNNRVLENYIRFGEVGHMGLETSEVIISQKVVGEDGSSYFFSKYSRFSIFPGGVVGEGVDLFFIY